MRPNEKQFDMGGFRSVPKEDLPAYIEHLYPDGVSGPSLEEMGQLLKEIGSFDDFHATYVVIWAVEMGLPSVADAIVGVLRRCEDRGGQYTLTRVLGKAKDLSRRHIDEVERIYKGSPHFILGGGLAELKEAWERRVCGAD